VRYKDIVLPNLKKNYITQAEVLNEIYAEVNSIEAYLARPIMGAYPKHVPKSMLAKGYYFEDSDDIIFASYDLVFERVSLSKKIDFGMDAGQFYIQEQNNKRINGWRYGASLYYKHFVFRIGQNYYDDFSEVVPSLAYVNSYKNHSYQFKFIQQNAVFYTYRPSVIDARIKANHFEFSDYVTFRDKTSLWMNLEVNDYSNNDTEVTVQYDWRFYYHKIAHTKFSYDLALEGWYTTHSRETNLYYSPHFADSTLIRFDPEYIFSKSFGLRGIFGIGYSFSDENTPYKYGMSIFGNPNDTLSYELGCLYNNSVRGLNTATYNYLECDFSLGYSW
jgi:hypothetical protein